MSMFVEYARSTELYKALCLSMDSPHGNLLERTSDETAEAQTEFLRWAFRLATPKNFIETGTNKCFFSYLVWLTCPGAHIHTFDINTDCEKPALAIQDAVRLPRVIFHLGDTRSTLSEWKVPADFAWIDGGHEFNVAISDLLNCARLGIPYIAVDDMIDAHEPGWTEVKMAVEHFIAMTCYRLHPNPFAAHDSRGAVLLRRQD